jgi:hypothetical protein
LRYLPGQAESGGGVFDIAYYEIVFPAVFPPIVKESFDTTSPRLAIDIPDEK